MSITFNADDIFAMAIEIEQNGARFYRKAAENADTEEIKEMLSVIGLSSVNELINKTVPRSILSGKKLKLDKAMSEYQFQKHFSSLLLKNKIYKSYIGTGYYNTITPSVIWRNIFENPVWYTSYTPYQAEISQGRLEALLNFQTVITELTACEIANASLLDEATAASEAMILMSNSVKQITGILKKLTRKLIEKVKVIFS